MMVYNNTPPPKLFIDKGGLAHANNANKDKILGTFDQL